MGASQAEPSRQTLTRQAKSWLRRRSSAVSGTACQAVTETDDAVSIKLSASSHPAIFWNPSRRKKIVSHCSAGA